MFNTESPGDNILRIGSRVNFPLSDFMPSDRQDIHYNLFPAINHHQSSKSGHTQSNARSMVATTGMSIMTITTK
jgi:hypothetical protein